MADGAQPAIDDYALACAVDALYCDESPDYATEGWRRKHGYPAPIFGPTRERALIVVRAYLAKGEPMTLRAKTTVD